MTDAAVGVEIELRLERRRQPQCHLDLLAAERAGKQAGRVAAVPGIFRAAKSTLDDDCHTRPPSMRGSAGRLYPASMPLTSARQVIGPTTPSDAAPTAVWNPRTNASVRGPKMPSTCTGVPSPSDWSWNLITSCTARTASPVLPLWTWTMSRDQVAGPTIPSFARPFSCWNALTADSVLGPKMPSTATSWFRAHRSRCSGRTGKTLSPRLTSGKGAIGSAGMCDSFLLD